MNIASVRYADATHGALLVTLDDGRVVCCPWPNRTWYAEHIQAWLEAGGTIAEAAQSPTPPDMADVDNLEKGLKALGLVMAQWAGKTPAQLKAAFKAAWETLP